MKLEEHLRGLDRTALVRLLELRPDVLLEPAPRHWEDLAQALSTRNSIGLALPHLDQDALTTLQALQVLGPKATPAALATTLAAPPSLVTAALSRLAEYALVWPTSRHRLCCPARLAGWWPAPLGLGAPAADLLVPYALAELQALAAAHALSTDGTRAALTRRLATRLASRPRTARLLANLPIPAAELLTDLLHTGPRLPLTEDLPAATLAPLLAHGLLLRRGKTALEVPREVGQALAERRPRLTGPPTTPTSPATPALATSQAAVAAAEAVRLTTTLLEQAEADPIPALLSGGIGTREQRRVAATLDCPVTHAALWLDLAYAAGLLGHHRAGHHLDSYAPTPAYETWRAQPAPARWTTLARAWLTLPETPTHRLTPDNRPIPPTTANPGPARSQRQALLTTYATLPPAHRAEPQAIHAQLAWRAPLLADTPHTQALLQATHTEAHLLGLISEGQLTPTGQALLATAPHNPWLPTSAEMPVPATPAEAHHAPTAPSAPAPIPAAPNPAEAEPAEAPPAEAESTGPAAPERSAAEAHRAAAAVTAAAAHVAAKTAATSTPPTATPPAPAARPPLPTPPGTGEPHPATEGPAAADRRTGGPHPAAEGPAAADRRTGEPHLATAPPAARPAGAAPATPDPGAALLAAATALLPATADTIRLQSDLTAVVTGDPAQHLVRLLDTTADLETNSSARIWRFSAGTIRRALDTGATAESLLADLAEVAPGGVPQPLEYLIRDVARRHGSIRVVEAGCVLHTADEVQALEIVNSRVAERLRLRQVAATVLVSPRSRGETLAQLRRAGFSPVGEDRGGNPVREELTPRRGQPRTAGWRPEDHAGTPADLAAALLAAAPVVKPVDPERRLRVEAPELPEVDRGWLAAAISSGGPVEISYRSPDEPEGARVVSDLSLERGVLLAWCHRHETEARFLVERIVRARPISGPVSAGRAH